MGVGIDGSIFSSERIVEGYGYGMPVTQIIILFDLTTLC